MFDVVSPAGQNGSRSIDGADGVGELNGKTVGFIWDNAFRGDLMFGHIADALRDQWPDVRFIGHETFGHFHGPDELRVMEELPTKLRESEVDAVFVGVGACGSCTPAVMRSCAIAEDLGIAAVALIAEGFIPQGKAIARALGLSPAIARYPGVVMTDSLDVFHGKVKSTLVPEALAGLIRNQPPNGENAPRTGMPEETYDPRAVVFSGTLERIQRHFEERMWTDGLPVMPPTLAAVDAMLEHTRRDPDEILGTLLPANRDATIWNVAVTAVMSGCDPRHLPMLIAAAESMCDERFGVQHGGATPGWEPFAIISGPVVDPLGFNSGVGALRVGPRANTSFGRFLRLFMRNVGGVAGATDKATFGAPTQVALAESDEWTRRIGWPTLREEQGFGLDDTTVTVQSVVGFSLPIYTESEDPEPHLRVLAEHIAGVSGHWSCTGLLYREWQPLLVMTPAIAAVFAANGMTKDDLRRELSDRARVPYSQMTGYVTAPGLILADLEDKLRDGTARAAYLESDDPDRLVPVIPFPERLDIVVAGDAPRNQSKYYVNNHVHGPRIATRVDWGSVPAHAN
jgi:hypothetical protein